MAGGKYHKRSCHKVDMIAIVVITQKDGGGRWGGGTQMGPSSEFKVEIRFREGLYTKEE